VNPELGTAGRCSRHISPEPYHAAPSLANLFQAQTLREVFRVMMKCRFLLKPRPAVGTSTSKEATPLQANAPAFPVGTEGTLKDLV
jgi:hypothetical protein